MQEEEASVSKFVEGLRSAAAAVGQQAGTLVADRVGQSIEMNEDREARIAELRRQHVEGSYHVDPADVAARIIDDHLA